MHSLSYDPLGKMMLSGDDLTCNIWSPEKPQQFMNAVNKAPAKIPDLAEVITSCKFSRENPSLFCISSSLGYAEIHDLREN
jgi:hypothetical protein